MGKINSMLDAIRKRPNFYLGEKSLTDFRTFRSGYDMAIFLKPEEAELLHIPEDFSDWVREKLNQKSAPSAMGWYSLILRAVEGNEAKAFDVFLTF